MDPITPATRMQPGSDVLFSLVGDEAVLLNVTSGVYYALDRVGVLVWTEGVGGKSLGEIHQLLQRQFSVKPSVLWRDVVALLTDFAANGLVTLSLDTAGAGPANQSDLLR